MIDALEPGFVRLQASVPTRARPAVVAALLRGDAAAWLGSAQRLEDGGDWRRFAVDLRTRVGADDRGLVTLRKAAILDVGPVRDSGDECEAEISWRAASAAPLFPVFSGLLRATDATLNLEGIYAPPGGIVGRVADRLLLHTAANGTANWVLRQLAAAARERG